MRACVCRWLRRCGSKSLALGAGRWALGPLEEDETDISCASLSWAPGSPEPGAWSLEPRAREPRGHRQRAGLRFAHRHTPQSPEAGPREEASGQRPAARGTHTGRYARRQMQHAGACGLQHSTACSSGRPHHMVAPSPRLAHPRPCTVCSACSGLATKHATACAPALRFLRFSACTSAPAHAAHQRMQRTSERASESGISATVIGFCRQTESCTCTLRRPSPETTAV